MLLELPESTAVVGTCYRSLLLVVLSGVQSRGRDHDFGSAMHMAGPIPEEQDVLNNACCHERALLSWTYDSWADLWSNESQRS